MCVYICQLLNMKKPRNLQDRVHLLKICILTILLMSDSVCAAEPFTIGVAAAATLAGIFTVGNRFWCNIRECCNKNWAEANTTALVQSLKERVHGQHLVQEVVANTIHGHIKNPNPSKALVLSFNGWTGGGKNFVSKIIAENLFQLGMNSKYVHLFVATLHFPHASHLEEYKTQLHHWITSNVSKCEWQLFIFDETDKMQSGLIDVIKPFLEFYPDIAGVDYRKSIYIFLSNTGGNDITVKTLEHWQEGEKREEITVKEMDQLLQKNAFNEEGGLWHSELIERHLISFFVPFLPLERSHIIQCIEDELRAKNYQFDRRDPKDMELIRKIADELQYDPPDKQLFSRSGCKRVAEKVNLIMYEHANFFKAEL